MSEGFQPAPLFFERQRLNRLWLLVPLLPLTGVVAALLAGGLKSGEIVTLAVVAAFAIALTALLAAIRLDVEVTGDGVHVRMPPFVGRRLALEEIAGFEARTYRPIREYGGWGIRWGPSGRAYNLRGNRGVQLTLADGQRLLLGSQRAGELAAAIEAAAAK